LDHNHIFQAFIDFMARFEIYTKQLLQAGCGHPIWRPDPCKESAVEIADVGYLENGKWVTLFNGSKEHKDESNKLGAPGGYYPLQVGQDSGGHALA
jgi:hypothetical protein